MKALLLYALAVALGIVLGASGVTLLVFLIVRALSMPGSRRQNKQSPPSPEEQAK